MKNKCDYKLKLINFSNVTETKKLCMLIIYNVMPVTLISKNHWIDQFTSCWPDSNTDCGDGKHGRYDSGLSFIVQEKDVEAHIDADYDNDTIPVASKSDVLEEREYKSTNKQYSR